MLHNRCVSCCQLWVQRWVCPRWQSLNWNVSLRPIRYHLEWDLDGDLLEQPVGEASWSDDKRDFGSWHDSLNVWSPLRDCPRSSAHDTVWWIIGPGTVFVRNTGIGNRTLEIWTYHWAPGRVGGKNCDVQHKFSIISLPLYKKKDKCVRDVIINTILTSLKHCTFYLWLASLNPIVDSNCSNSPGRNFI